MVRALLVLHAFWKGCWSFRDLGAGPVRECAKGGYRAFRSIAMLGLYGHWPVAAIRFRAHHAGMGDYAAIGGVIDEWVKKAGSTLFTEWAGAPARYFHIPGDPPFECFQVSVLAPENGRTSVVARAIDTNDDAEDEMDQTWEGPLTELDGMLGSAFFTIEKWKSRERKRPDPASPWDGL